MPVRHTIPLGILIFLVVAVGVDVDSPKSSGFKNQHDQ